MIINTKNINEARKLIDKTFNEKKQVIVQAQDSDFNRKILENKKVSVLLSPELTEKDKLKERGSGLNEVLCRISSKNKIKIGINLEEILKTQGKQKAILLSRIMQNLKLCKRTKTDLKLFPETYDKKNAFSWLLSLGDSTQQAKKSILGN